MELLLGVQKIRRQHNGQQMYAFWLKDENEQGKGYQGRMVFVSEEDLRQKLMTHGFSEAQVDAELAKIEYRNCGENETH